MRQGVYGQSLVLLLFSHCNPFTQSFVHTFYIMALPRYFEKHKGFGSHNDNKPVVTHAFFNQKYEQVSYYFEMSLPSTIKIISKVTRYASSRLDLKKCVTPEVTPLFLYARVKFILEESNASTRARNACLNLKEEGCCCTVLRYHQNELPKDCILFCIRLSGGQELVAQGARDRFT